MASQGEKVKKVSHISEPHDPESTSRSVFCDSICSRYISHGLLGEKRKALIAGISSMRSGPTPGALPMVPPVPAASALGGVCLPFRLQVGKL